MSTTIDERVVEMRFDNRQFEAGVQTSLSTLDKLKASLDLDGAAKGLEGLGKAANKCDLSTLSNSVETVRMKFSALEVMAMTALSNITNSAVNAGKRLISQFTVKPIASGFSEYELKMGSIQTIMASTGESLDVVNQKLDELNRYSDLTIYSFSDMTSNIGKFTNAGVKLDDAVAAIQGVSNAAAVSGANANEASRAMYNFAQALSAGYVKLIDWKSIENANMATVEFKTQLLDAAVAAGTVEKTADGMYKVLTKNGTGSKMDGVIDATHNFNDSLSYQWMTTEVLTSTLKDYADETTEIGKKAFAAAQDVKTWSQLLDTLKESAQSGWAETWQLIVGDYEEAKTTLRDFSEFFSGIIDGASEARNNLLSGALMSSWGQLKDEIGSAGISADTFREKLREAATEAVPGLDKMIETAGSFDATLSRGWLTTDILAQTLDKLANEATGTTGGLAALNDEQLKNAGYTEEQITALRSLGEQARSSSGEIAALVGSMTRQSGRELLFDSLLNSCKAIRSVFAAMKEAWSEVFPPVTSERIYQLIAGLNSLTQKLTMSEETAAKLKSTFKGAFAVVDIFRQALSALARAFSPLAGSAASVGGSFLSITASIGEWLVRLDEAIAKTDIFGSAAEKLSGFLRGLTDAVGGFLNKTVKTNGLAFLSALFEGLARRVKNAKEALTDMKNSIGGVDGSGLTALLQALANAAKKLSGGIFSALAEGIGKLVTAVSNADFSGIIDLLNGISLGGIALMAGKFVKTLQSPFEGVNGIFGNISGILGNISGILGDVRESIKAYQEQLKAGTLLKIAGAIAILAGAIVAISLVDTEKLLASLGAITVLFADLVGAMTVFNQVGSKARHELRNSAVMIALSTSVLVLAVALKEIADLDGGQIVKGVAGVTALMAGMAGAVKLLGMGGGKTMKGAAQMVVFAASIKILASACGDFAQMNAEQLTRGLASIGVVLAELAAFTKLAGSTSGIVTTGAAMIGVAAAMKIFASAAEDFGNLNEEQLSRGLTAMGAALAEVAVATKLMPKNMAGIGVGLIAVGAALTIVANVLSKLGDMETGAISQSLIAMGVALGELAIALNVMNGTLAGSAALLVAAGALAVLTPVLLTLGSMSVGGIAKGLIALAGAFTVIGVAGALLTPLVPTILSLSAAFALIGVGIAAIGAGLLATGAGLSAIAVGIAALATSMGAGVTVIVAGLTSIITGVAALIPAVAAKLGEAVAAFCKVIADGAPALGEAFKAVVLTFVDVLTECVPAVAEGALTLLTSALSSLASHTPQIVESIMLFLIHLLDGVAERLPELIRSAVDVIAAFFSGIVDALAGLDTSVLAKTVAGIGLLSGIFVALGAITALIPSAMAGVLGMGALVAELALVLAAAGAFAQLPGLSWLIGEGGALLENLGTAIGGFVGGIVGGFMSGISSQFPQIGSDLAAFMTNAKPFIDGASDISPDMLTGVKALTGAIVLLTGAELLRGLTSWLTGGSSLSKFAEELVPFGEGIKNYSLAVRGLDASAINNSAAAGKALAELANTIPNCGGLVSFFTGSNDISDFGEQLVVFGTSLSNYSDAVEHVNIAKLSSTITQVEKLAALADILKDVDEYAFVSFANSLTMLAGSSIKSFTDAFYNSGSDVKKAVICLLDAAGASIQQNETIVIVAVSELMAALAASVKTHTATMNTAVVEMMVGFGASIRENGGTVRTAMRSVLIVVVAEVNDSRSEFSDAGRNVSQGFISGIRSKLGDASRAGRDLGLAALNAAKKALDSHSPSREFIELGKNIGEGMTIGIDNSITPVTSAAAKMSGEAIKVAKKGLDAYKEWAEERKYYSELSLKEELAAWETLQQKYREGSEERKEIDREVYRVQNELVNATYEHSMDWIEEQKYYGKLTLAEELAAYKRVQSRYAKGSELRIKLDREVYTLEKEISDAQKQYIEDVQAAQTEANENRIALEEEYADTVKSINAQLESDIEAQNERYENALESREESLYKAYGLFDAVQERDEVSGETLMKNLEGQVKEFGEWQDILQSLSGRGLDSELIEELQDMGPDAIAQVKALNDMSDDELSKYAELWQVKHALAREQAVSELEDLREETQENIAKLREEADAELAEYRETWQERMDQITTDTDAKLQELRKSFEETVGLIKDNTEDELTEMSETAQKILTEAGWDETGKQIVNGLTEGVAEQKSSFIDELTQMALAGVEAVKSTLDINSPSRVFRELGNYTGLGFIKGLHDYVERAYTMGSELAEHAEGGLSSVLQTIAELVSGGFDAEPVIRPVLDLSAVSAGASALDSLFYSQRAVSLAGQASAAIEAQRALGGQAAVTVNNDGVVEELRTLRSDIASMLDRMEKLRVVLNTGTLVGELAGPMDSALGQRAALRERGI